MGRRFLLVWVFSMREVHGVGMRPMNTNPASVAGGISTAISALRISFSRTILALLNYYREGDGAVHLGVLWARHAPCEWACGENLLGQEIRDGTRPSGFPNRSQRTTDKYPDLDVIAALRLLPNRENDERVARNWENGSALRLRDSEIRQYRQIWAHGAWRSKNLRPLPTISVGVLNSSEP
jgi:hypothetical protein